MDIKNKIDNMLKNAKNALNEYMKMDQEKINKIVKAVYICAKENSISLAKLAILETKRGILKDKIFKNLFASETIYENIKSKKTVGIIKKNLTEGITEIADPLGVIAGITPVTNPTSTTIFKILVCIKTRNPIIFCFHPNSWKCCVKTAEILTEAAIKAGAPKNSIQWVENPTLEITSKLINHPEIDAILATGGTSMVKAAYSSGKPALGVGPGNVPCYIEKTANLKTTCKDIISSKTFDNGMICASEQSIIVDKEIAKNFETEMKKLECYFLKKNEISKLSEYAFPSGKLNSKIVGKSATEIAKTANIEVPKNTKILILKLEKSGEKEPLSAEKLSPILSYYIAENTKKALEICTNVLCYGGRGHTAVIHSKNKDIINKFSIQMMAGRILVNSPATQGAIGGICNNNTPSLTLGCGSYGKNSVTSNISVENLVNIKRIFLKQ